MNNNVRSFPRWWYLGIFFLFPDLSHAQNDSTNLSTQLVQQVLQSQSQTTPSPSGGQAFPNVPEPSLPQVQESPSPKHESNSQIPSHINNLQGVQGMIISDDDQQFHGILYFPTFSLNIHQTYQGKDFLKILPSSQIRTLSCLQWSAFSYQEEKTFQFVCTLYKIHDRENHEYMYSKIIPSISQIVFKNEKGSSLFYLYFVDYMKGDHWENLKMPFRQKFVSTPLKGVIRSLYFGQNTSSSFPSPLTNSPELLPSPPKEDIVLQKTRPSSQKKKTPHYKKTIKHKKKAVKILSTDTAQNLVSVPVTKGTLLSPAKKTEKPKDYEKIPIRSRR